MSDELRGWEFVCTEAELLPGEKKTVWDGDTPILVVNVDGEMYAVEDRCTHEDFELSAARADGGRIECVLHGAKFDLRTGEAMNLPATAPVRTYPVRVHDGHVQVSRT